MSLAYDHATVPAHPLGIPVDGRERYGMTAEQAALYRYLVKTFLMHDVPFRVRFRNVGAAICSDGPKVYARVKALVERGWLEKCAGHGIYRFVHPVKLFKVPR